MRADLIRILSLEPPKNILELEKYIKDREKKIRKELLN